MFPVTSFLIFQRGSQTGKPCRKTMYLTADEGIYTGSAAFSLMVIGFSFNDRAGTVKLFGKDETHHLVGKRHAG